MSSGGPAAGSSSSAIADAATEEHADAAWHLHRHSSQQSAVREMVNNLLPGSRVVGDGRVVFKCAVKRYAEKR